MEYQKRRKRDQVTGEFCQRFGAVAVHKGFVTLDQVKLAMNEQIDDDLNGREHRLLGTILVDHGWLSDHQIEAVLLELRRSL